MTFAKGAALKDPCGPLQLQSPGEHPAGHRLPRGRDHRRSGVEDAGSGRCDPEPVQHLTARLLGAAQGRIVLGADPKSSSGRRPSAAY